MRKPIAVGIFLLSIFSNAPPSLACSCVGMPLKYAYKSSAAMFTASVLSISNGGGGEIRLRVTEVFKGNIRVGSEATVSTSPFGETCGYFFQRRDYLVHASLSETGNLTTGLCMHTMPLGSEAAEQEIALLRSRSWWWRLPLSYPGRYAFRMWYFRHF